jgi:hypothetical protein
MYTYTADQMRAYAAEQVAAERERCLDVRLSDDDALRFACRVLESDAPEADKASARDGLMAIRVRMRGVTAPAQAAGCAPGEG